MSDRFSRIEERLRYLDETVACLAQRLQRLERAEPSGHPVLAATADPGHPVPGQLHSLPHADAVALLSLAGRTCLVFGGAYLLRALTESGAIPASSGVLLGLLYAVGWLAAAERASRTSALFHGLAAVLIGLPIVWEAAVRFRFLSPVQSAATLACLIALGLTVAWHRRLQVLAAVIAIGAFATTAALVVALGRVLPFATLLLGVAAASLWVAYHRRWIWLAFLTALVADLAVVAATVRALATPPRDPAGAVLVVQAALIAVYFGSFTARALRGESLRIFEFAQGGLALAIGLGGAIAVVRAAAITLDPIGTAAVAGAAIAYALALGPVRARRTSRANVHFFAALGLALALVGGPLLLDSAEFAIVLSVGAVAAIATQQLLRFSALAVHGLIALLAAGGFSGALEFVNRVWFSVLPAWPGVTTSAWIVIAAAVACFIVSAARADEDVVVSRVRSVLAALTVAGLATFLVVWAGPLLAGAAPDAGSTATVKSLVLAVAAVLLAWTRRVAGLGALGHLTYPVLVAGGLKIVLEDLSASRPATLFVALAMYGAALILAPRVLRSNSRANQVSQG